MSLFNRARPKNRLHNIFLTGTAAVDRPAQELANLLVRKDDASDLTRVLVVKRLPQVLPHQSMPEGLVTGIVAVSTRNGAPYHDTQGDYIPVGELHSMAKQLLSGKAVFNPMHLQDPETGKPIDAGYATEAIVLDHALQKALGIRLPDDMECLIATFKVTDPTTLRLLADGAWGGFSIEGKGQRTPVEKSMSDEQTKIEAEAVVAAFEKARANAPQEWEKLRGYVTRVFKGQELSQMQRVAVESAFRAAKEEVRKMKHESYLAKRAGDKLVDLAKSAAGALGISYERAFAEVCKTHGDLYRQAQKAGAFHFTEKGAVKGPGFDQPGASPENHADGPGDYEGEAGEPGAFEESNSFYTPEDVSEEIEDARQNFDDAADADVAQIRKTADALESKACLDGKTLSRQQAIVKSYKLHNEAYARLRKAGRLNEV